MRRARSAAGIADAARRPGGPTPRSPRRTLLLALAAAVMAVTSAACSGNQQTSDPQQAPTQAAPSNRGDSVRDVPKALTPAARLQNLGPAWRGWAESFYGGFKRDGPGNIIDVYAEHRVELSTYETTLAWGSTHYPEEIGELVFLDDDGAVIESLQLDDPRMEGDQCLNGDCPRGGGGWLVDVVDPPNYAAYRVVSKRSADAEPETVIEFWRSRNTPTANFTDLAEGDALDGRGHITVTLEVSDLDADRLFIEVYLTHENSGFDIEGIRQYLNYHIRHPLIVEPSASGYIPISIILDQTCDPNESYGPCAFPSPVQQARLRVLVSDGANWTVADSPTFSVAHSPP